jgi:hypothetical protein
MPPLARPLTLVLTAAVLAGALPSTAAAAAPTTAIAAPLTAAPLPAAAGASQPRLDHRDAWSETDVTALPAAGRQALLEGRFYQHSDLTPTGRFVRAGDTVTFDVSGAAPVEYAIAASGVFADLNGGTSGARVPTSTPLPVGSTRVTAASDGLVYLRSVGAGDSARVRVTGGAPQPVFQLGATTDAAFADQLTRWSGSRFVLLLGDRVIGEFQRSEVDAARTAPSWDAAGTVASWDRAADLVAEAHGMDPAATGVARPAGHRIRMVNPDTGPAWGSASHGAIMFQTSSGAGQQVLGALRDPNQWGLWHEIGHTYQNRAYRWDGMAEVQVNLYSSYVQRRLGIATRYTPTQDAVQKARALFTQPVEQRASSGASHELMLEQLGRAFGDAFYPRVNQEYRVLAATGGDVPREHDEKVQQFIRTASQVAGHDLSDFFRQWGLPADAATRTAVTPLPDLPQPIWTVLDPTAMPLVHDVPAYVLPTGRLDGAGLPGVASGWSTLPVGWRDRVRDVGSADGSTPARFVDSGVLTGGGHGALWVRLVNDAGVHEVLTAPLAVDRGNGLTFRGFDDAEVLHVDLATDTGTWAVRSAGGLTHELLPGEQYIGVELIGADGVPIASGTATGDRSSRTIAEALHGVPAEDGQYLRVHHREPHRLDVYVDGSAQTRATARDQVLRVDGGRLQPVAPDQVATPPVLTVQPGLGSTIATLTMSASVFEKASRHVVRHGGAYAFEIHRGSAYYASTARSADGTTVTVTAMLPAGTGDVSLHRVAGTPGGPTTDATLVSTHPAVTAEPTAAQRDGVHGVYVAPGTLGLRMSGTAYTSTTRHLVYVNGTFVFEVHAGKQYGARRTASGGITVVEAALPQLSPHDVVEVRLASGQPGDPRYGVAVHTYTVTPADLPNVTPR